jgi:hypothetical protein
VDVEIVRDGPENLAHERQEFLVPIPRCTLVNHPPGRDIQSSEEIRRAMPLVIVRHGSGPSALERQPGLRSVQCLDLRLFVDREHDGSVRWIHVKTDHITQLVTVK